ncbi:hypothetical protein CP532_3646 [Ophiocordyceps camponoti-leonardi (nom. inval.)]|nr:hypothetical protein CP532_3646 [Ophiocordyceps camponoti-leonardi (nom. inval.)]
MKTFRVPPAVLPTVLFLLCLLTSVRAAGSDDGQQSPPGKTPNITIVYRWDSRPPQQIRADGGWRPPYEDYEDNRRAFYVYHHNLGELDDEGFPREDRWRTAYVTAHANMTEATADSQGWLYRIHASENMIMPDDANTSRVYALGGIHWAQVRSYRPMNSTRFILNRRDHNYERYAQDSVTVVPSTDSPFLREPATWDRSWASDYAHALLSKLRLGARLGYHGLFPLSFERFSNDSPPQSSTSHTGSDVPENQPGPSGVRTSRPRGGRRKGAGTCRKEATKKKAPKKKTPSKKKAAKEAAEGDSVLNEHSYSSSPREDCSPEECCDTGQEREDHEWIDSYIDSVVQRGRSRLEEPHGANDEAGQAEQFDDDEPAEDEGRPRKKQKPNEDTTTLSYETTTPNPLEQLPDTSNLTVDDIDWRALAAMVVLCENAFGGSRTKRSVPEFYSKKTCDDASNKIRKLDSCERVSGLQVGFTLSNDDWSGTSSEISLVFDGPQGPVRIPIADGPSRGFKTWKSFGIGDSGVSQLQDIKNIRIECKEKNSFPWFSQAWQLQDLELRARCVETSDLMVMEKYKPLNKWFESPDKKITTWQDVGNLPVTTRDWKMKPPCNYLSSLFVNFTVGDRNWAGTDSSIAFSVNSMSKPIILAKEPTRGTFVSKEIKLEDYFGAEVLQVRDLNKMRLLDQTSGDWSLTSGWFLQGVTLSGKCVASGKRISMNKFVAVDDWYEHKNPIEKLESVWDGEFSPEDWS